MSSPETPHIDPLRPGGGGTTVSIVIPAFNAERFVEEAVRSALGQTCRPLEVIVVDDGSTDHTAEVVESLRDPRVQLVRQAHGGLPGEARNAGARRARGDLLAFLDADDAYEPDGLAALVSHLGTHPDAVAAHGFYRVVDETGRLLAESSHLRRTGGALTLRSPGPPSWEDVLAGSTPHTFQTLVVRRSAFERVGGIPPLPVAQDLAFFVRLRVDAFHGVHAVPVYVARYREHAESLTNDPRRLDRALESFPRLVAWLFEEAGLPAEARTPRLRSRTAAALYSYRAETRWRAGARDEVRRIGRAALQDPDVSRRDWFASLAPFWARTLLPTRLVPVLRGSRTAGRRLAELP